MFWQVVDDGYCVEYDEGDDGDYFEQCELEFEFVVVGYVEEVGDGEQEGYCEGEDLGVDGWELGVEDGCGGDCFEWDYQYLELLVELVDGEIGLVVDGVVGVGGEGIGIGGGDCYFVEYVYDQYYQGVGDQVGEQGGWVGGGDGMVGVDEQVGVDYFGD